MQVQYGRTATAAFFGGLVKHETVSRASPGKEEILVYSVMCVYIQAQGPGRIESLALFMMGTTFRITPRPFTQDHVGG